MVKILNDFWLCSNQQVAGVLLLCYAQSNHQLLQYTDHNIDVSFVTMFLVTIITDFAFVFSNL